MDGGATPPAADPDIGSHRTDRVLERLGSLVGCDMAAVSGLARVEGRWVHDRVVVRGGGAARDVWMAGQGRPQVGPWDPERPVWSHMGRFRRTFAPSPETLETLWNVPVYARFYLPVGLTSDARMLVYDGDRFVCWVGLLRADPARPFGARQLRSLNRAAAAVTDELVAIDRGRRAEERGAPADLVFGPDGRLEAACAEGRAWIDEGRRDVLASIVRRADRRGPEGALVRGRVVHVSRLEGPAGVRYLVNLRPPVRPRLLPGARLTPRQREVAMLAARGATVDEIASHLGSGRETVRQHLKRTYATLGVASRLELARALS